MRKQRKQCGCMHVCVPKGYRETKRNRAEERVQRKVEEGSRGGITERDLNKCG